MEINTEYWGLNEQYSDSKSSIILFPQTVNYDSLKYLISLGFRCIIGSYYINESWISLSSIQMLDIYRYAHLIPLPESIKVLYINTFSLKKIPVELDD